MPRETGRLSAGIASLDRVAEGLGCFKTQGENELDVLAVLVSMFASLRIRKVRPGNISRAN